MANTKISFIAFTVRMVGTRSNAYNYNLLCKCRYKMKQEAIENATFCFNPLFNDNYKINWEDDEVMICMYSAKHVVRRKRTTIIDFRPAFGGRL